MLQFGPKRTHNFWTIGLNKSSNENRTRRSLFYSVFSYGKHKDSSLTYFLVFVLWYLELFENIDQMSKKHIFFSFYFIEMKPMASLF